MAILGEYYHVGIVVPDVEAAMAHLTELLGVAWGPVVETDAFDVRAGDGNDLVVPNKLCYSTAPPHLELVLEVPGSVWECNEHSNLHHIGVWTDSLPADSAALLRAAVPAAAVRPRRRRRTAAVRVPPRSARRAHRAGRRRDAADDGRVHVQGATSLSAMRPGPK